MSAAQTTARARAQTKKTNKARGAAQSRAPSAPPISSTAPGRAGRVGRAARARAAARLHSAQPRRASARPPSTAACAASAAGLRRARSTATRIHDGAARIAAVCVPQRPLAEEWQGRRAAYCRATFARAQVVLANELCGTVAGARSVVGRVSIRGWSSNTVRAQPALPRAAAGARTAECGPVSCGPIEYSHPKEARTLV